MKTKIELITPELAKYYLTKNTKNRPLTKKIVNSYFIQMSNNNWKSTGQSISFDVKGNLIDGQHRLEAMIRANKSYEYVVVTDIEEDAFVCYDTGKKRSAKDCFSIEGIKNYTNTSSGIARYITVSNELSNITKTNYVDNGISNQTVLDIYYSDVELWDEIVIFSRMCYNKIRILKMSEITGISYYLIRKKGHSKETVFSFFEQVFDIKQTEFNCIKLYRNILLKNKYLSRVKLSNKHYSAFLIKTWNFFITGTDTKILKWDFTQENFPKFI